MAGQSARDLLIVGLRNAHAMERQAQELMERQSGRSEEFPEVRARLSQHLGETRGQLQRIEQCLRECGETESSLKDVKMSAMGNVTAMAQAMAGDEILKNTFAHIALEHYEIAAYKSLLALSEQAGIDLSQPLQSSLCEEEDMAAWIDEHIRDVTLQYVAKQEQAAA